MLTVIPATCGQPQASPKFPRGWEPLGGGGGLNSPGAHPPELPGPSVVQQLQEPGSVPALPAPQAQPCPQGQASHGTASYQQLQLLLEWVPAIDCA